MNVILASGNRQIKQFLENIINYFIMQVIVSWRTGFVKEQNKSKVVVVFFFFRSNTI